MIGPASRLGGRLGHLESRRQDLERIDGFLIKATEVYGFCEVVFEAGGGEQEGLADITFPVWFLDKPAMSFSGELVRDLVEAGAFPKVNLLVVGWTTVHQDRPGGGYYTGARVGVVASGRDGERMIVHWQARGKALRTPVGPS